MVYITKFRANDLNPSKGKQIEFNASVVENFFKFTQDECSVSIKCLSLADSNFEEKITATLKLSPARGDYKIYQNDDRSKDLKDVFLLGLHLTAEDNIDDFYAIKKKSDSEYVLYFVPKNLLFNAFFPSIKDDQLLMGDPDETHTVVKCDEQAIQRIIYGAPGTGKSWSIEELVKNAPDQVVRTTFHPDSDYSTFVGAYKPTMADVPWYYIDKGKKACVLDENDQPAKETKIVYKFVEQAFTKAYVKAWKAQDAALAANQPIGEPVYLVIEEINRGNCAQAFGDIFQLLDRDERGYSKYPVDADQDLARHLKEAFAGAEDGGRGATALPPEIADGTKLRLPPNLCIWATMNTSDQSLFPMDSAFKRRWDWEYKPIADGRKGWFVQVNVPEKKDGQGQITEPAKTLKYDWWQFLGTINAKIYNLTDSEDKELGYYFVKAGADQVISAETFVGKVIFYLWNDVYKDYGIAEIFKGEQNGESAEEKKVKGVPFRKFYDDSDQSGKKINVDTLVNFFKAVGVEPKA